MVPKWESWVADAYRVAAQPDRLGPRTIQFRP